MAQEPKSVVIAQLIGERIVCEDTDKARELYNHSRFGSKDEDGRVVLSFHDAVYLLGKEKIAVKKDEQELSKDQVRKIAADLEPNFIVRHAVFSDFRERGYVIKTALKFGADFRVYDRGVKPGEDHAKWVVFPVSESEKLNWQDFAAKNRVAHSTKKRLLIGCVDEEGQVTYWEVRWVRP